VLSAAQMYVLYEGRNLGKIGSRWGDQQNLPGRSRHFFEKVRTASVLYFTAISDLSKSELNIPSAASRHGRIVCGIFVESRNAVQRAGKESLTSSSQRGKK